MWAPKGRFLRRIEDREDAVNYVPELGGSPREEADIKKYHPELHRFTKDRADNINYVPELGGSRLCPYNCVKEKSHSHPHDTIILDQQNFVGGNENDSTQFYLKLRRTKRTNY